MGTDDRAPEALPVRTSRYRPTGRHRSQHQLSVPPEAPALVLAVPGAESDANNDIAAGVVAAARTSCPGVAVHYGYLQGFGKRLDAVLAGFHNNDGLPAAVVVPLLICPDAEADADLETAVASGGFPVIAAKPLGPHPVLAGALHTRLSEAGLARVDQIGQMSIASAAEGVLVAALGDTEAMSVAGTVAVLLAARLILPVAAASFSDPTSVKDATEQLRAGRRATRGTGALRHRTRVQPVRRGCGGGGIGPGNRTAARRPSRHRPARRHALRGRPAGSSAGRRGRRSPGAGLNRDARLNGTARLSGPDRASRSARPCGPDRASGRPAGQEVDRLQRAACRVSEACRSARPTGSARRPAGLAGLPGRPHYRIWPQGLRCRGHSR